MEWFYILFDSHSAAETPPVYETGYASRIAEQGRGCRV